jgi:hypothetical protein
LSLFPQYELIPFKNVSTFSKPVNALQIYLSTTTAIPYSGFFQARSKAWMPPYSAFVRPGVKPGCGGAGYSPVVNEFIKKYLYLGATRILLQYEESIN